MSAEPINEIIRKSGLSRRAFAKKHSVGEQVLLRLSQGRMTRIPASILDAVQDEAADFNERIPRVDELQEAYARFRDELPVSTLPTQAEIAEQTGSPIERLVKAVGSMSKLAKVLRVHDYVVLRYAKGLTRDLPATMREALESYGWPHTDQLDNAQRAWFDRNKAGQ